MKSIFHSTPRSRRAKPQPQHEAQAESPSAFFQPKLTINAPNDQYEREADAVADQVVNEQNSNSNAAGLNGQATIQRKPISQIQRLATPAEEKMPATNDARMAEDKMIQEKPEIQRIDEPKEEEKPIQKMDAPKEDEKPVQKMDAPKEEEKPIQKADEKEELQAKEEKEEPIQAKSQGGTSQASPNFSSRLSARKGQGSALPKTTQAQMEQGIGADFSQVRIHTDSEAAGMNKEISAQAFTHGQDVYFNQGKFSPESTDGKRLLAHELTHVVQQGSAQDITKNSRTAYTKPQGIQRDILNTLGDWFNLRDNEADLDLQEDLTEFKSQNYGPITYTRSQVSGSAFEASYYPMSEKLLVQVRAAVRFADTLIPGSGGFTSPNFFMNSGGFIPIINGLPPEVQAQILPYFQWDANEKQRALLRFRQNIGSVMNIWENTNHTLQVNEPGWEGIKARPDIDIQVREGDAVTEHAGLFDLFIDEGNSDHLQIEIVKQPSSAEIQSVINIIKNHNAALAATVNPNVLGAVRSYVDNDPNRSPGGWGNREGFNNFMSLESDRSDDPATRTYQHTVHFGHDRSDLNPDELTKLHQFFSDPMVLLDNAGRDVNITLEGFASHKGSFDYNTELVDRRINTVRSEIRARNNISPLNLQRLVVFDSNDSDQAAEAQFRDHPELYDEAGFRRVDIKIERIGRGGQNVLAHEFGHVFGLGDEYADVGRAAHTQANPNFATHNDISVLAGAGQATIGTDANRMMDAGNRVDAPHYSTFADVLNQLTSKSWKIVSR